MRVSVLCVFCYAVLLLLNAILTTTGTTLAPMSITIDDPPYSCSAIRSANYDVEWPATYSATLSKPPCVGENREFVYRICHLGEWMEEPNCIYIQPAAIPECPDGFTKSNNICYLFTAKTKFPPVCPYPDVLDFSSYKNSIGNQRPIWMPVKRNWENGLGFMQWTEPSLFYKDTFEQLYIVDEPIIGKDCLLFYNNSYIVAASCNEQHYAVCAYNIFSNLNNYLYEENNCIQSEYLITNRCIGIEQGTPATFLEPFQNNINKYLGEDGMCAIGLVKTSDGSYVWNRTFTEVQYTLWQETEIFEQGDRVVLTRDGWRLVESAECFVGEKEILIEEPQLNLPSAGHLSIENEKSIKRVDNNLLVFCFANGAKINLLYNQSNYAVFPTTEQGNYWCEAFVLPDLTIKSTSRQLVRNSSIIFIAILKVNYAEISNPLSKDIYKLLDTNIFLNNLTLDYNWKLMQILDVDEHLNEVKLNLHISSESSLKIDEYEAYLNLKKFFDENLNDDHVQLVDLRSTSFCWNETNKIEWPKTPVGFNVILEPYCFTSSKKVFVRYCTSLGFVDGATWTPVEDCEIPVQSQSSEDLILAIDAANSCQSPDAISLNYRQFTPFDIYLIGQFIQICGISLDYEQFYDIYNTVMDVEEGVLQESEEKMLALTSLLSSYFIYSPIEYQEFHKKYIHQRVVQVSAEVSGVMLIKEDNNYIFKLCNCNLTDLRQEENLEAAVIFGDENVNQSFLVSFLLSSVVFQEQFYIPTELDGMVFLVEPLYPSYRKSSESIKIIQRSKQTELSEKKCVAWMSSESGSFWQSYGTLHYTYHFVYCNASSDQYYAISSNKKSVTNDLNDLLKRNDTDVIHSLNTITDQYREFRPIDIFIVGQILEKVSSQNITEEKDLSALSAIIDNLQNIDNRLLGESQSSYGATDMILHYVDVILLNFDYVVPVMVETATFSLSIIEQKDVNFSGLALIDNKMQILESDGILMEVLASKNFESILVIDRQLKQQIGLFKKIVSTLFTTNVLFNEASSGPYNPSKIFGLLLPEIRAYAGPISVLHNVQSKKPKKCVHWLFNQTGSSAGHWSKDGAANLKFGFVECQYWHTTHFALLINTFIENDVLDWITRINCTLSLIGLGVVFITAALFSTWRVKPGNKIVLNFSFVIILQIIILYVSSEVRDTSHALCTSIGAILHYSVISEFCWMSLIAYLQYKKFVLVFSTFSSQVLLNSLLFSWVSPLLPVILVLIFGSYEDGNVRLCYPSNLSLYFGVWIPISLSIGMNLFFFISILFHVSSNRTTRRNSTANEVFLQWRLGFLLFFIFGLTWGFGFLAEYNFEAFGYLFCFLSTLQGLFVFIFFIVLNIDTKNMYARALKRRGLHPNDLKKRFSVTTNSSSFA